LVWVFGGQSLSHAHSKFKHHLVEPMIGLTSWHMKDCRCRWDWIMRLIALSWEWLLLLQHLSRMIY
jgi:hypothetical protein